MIPIDPPDVPLARAVEQPYPEPRQAGAHHDATRAVGRPERETRGLEAIEPPRVAQRRASCISFQEESVRASQTPRKSFGSASGSLRKTASPTLARPAVSSGRPQGGPPNQKIPPAAIVVAMPIPIHPNQCR